MTPSDDLLDEFQWRGLLNQCSVRDALAEHLAGGRRTLYCGFDPTADSLHIGSLVPLLALRRFQLGGHRPIALVGGATGLIGDPSFKASERALNERELVEQWVSRLRAQVARFVDLEDDGAIVVDNLDWTAGLDVIRFLRDVGKHFSVNEMVRKESVRARLEREDSGISYTEFSYMLLQSYDYVQLASAYDCSLQIGGSDQWGNITAGMDLVRKMLGRHVHALTLPLVTKADGSKFGKTESGTIWLDPARTSPYSFYQFWMNTADADVGRFLRYFTFLPREDVAALDAAQAAAPERREAQRCLAREVTRIVHGDAALASAERITEALFSGRIETLDGGDLAQLEQDGLPAFVASSPATKVGAALTGMGLAKSNSAAMQLIKSGAVSLNGQVVGSAGAEIGDFGSLAAGYLLLRRGKRHWGLVRLDPTDQDRVR
ncbi:MAG: tyrosine--tRNA ligase [Pseudomonadales bacterium]|jgi:tyrosyl-tRNA synthetase|nr:tyrosine--tRNA ligase [Pseudomonadales bacterium]